MMADFCSIGSLMAKSRKQPGTVWNFWYFLGVFLVAQWVATLNNLTLVFLILEVQLGIDGQPPQKKMCGAVFSWISWCDHWDYWVPCCTNVTQQNKQFFKQETQLGVSQHSRDSANPKITNILKHDFEFLVGSYQLSKGFTCVRRPHSDFNIDTNPMINTLERSSF